MRGARVGQTPLDEVGHFATKQVLILRSPPTAGVSKDRRKEVASVFPPNAPDLDIFWLKDHALDDPDLLPSPDEAAAEIVESLETALERFRGCRESSRREACLNAR